MKTALIFAIVTAVQARAQFFGLAANGDGSVVYFATPLVQKDSTQPAYGKLFRVNANGLSLQEAREFVPAPAGTAMTLSNAYNLQAVDVSSDGQVMAVVGWKDCFGGGGLCIKTEVAQSTTITTASGSADYEGTFRLSANGQWALAGIQTATSSYATVHVLNVSTGEETTRIVQSNQPGLSLPFTTSPTGRSIANDGTAVFLDPAGEAVDWFRAGSSDVHKIPIPGVYWSSIDASGQTVVFSPMVDGPVQAADLASGQVRILTPDGNNPVITDDGQRILYLSERTGTIQAWMIGIDGTGDRQLTHDPAGISQATLSGDGTVAYAVTIGGQLIRISIDSGEIQELIPRTPYVAVNPGLQTAPGNLTTLTGSGLAGTRLDATAPLPYTLGGVSLTIQGIPALLVNVQPDSLIFVTPPGVSVADQAEIVVTSASMSPFTGGTKRTVNVIGSKPSYFFQRPVYPLAWHEDWRGPVNSIDPAVADELIHVDAIGLGPTSPFVSYGLPAPSEEPLARLIGPPIQCTTFVLDAFNNRTSYGAAPVSFEGLAPGLAAVYQLDIRLPATVPDGDLWMSCDRVGQGLIPVTH